jgi:hypothetical protein
MFRFILLVFSPFFLLSGCNAAEQRQSTPTYTQTSFNPSKNMTPIPSQIIPMRTITPPPTIRNLSSSTLLPSTTAQTLTFTPLPTLPPDKAQAFVLELLKSNAGCLLPCWWGITPGKTSWEEAKSFLESFTILDGINEVNDELSFSYFQIPFPKDMGSIEHVYVIRMGIVDEIKVYNGKLAPSYNLVDMLTTYGQPDYVLVSAYYEPRHTNYMVALAVFYLHQGILVTYYDSHVEIIGEKIKVCPQSAQSPYLDLWSPSYTMSDQEIIKRFLDTKNWPPYHSLTEATGMNLETFYNMFTNKNNITCLNIPVELWPNP